VHQGASVVVSPLAGGPADPLVRCWFQVDATGRVTLPTLNEELPELNDRVDLVAQQSVLGELRAAELEGVVVDADANWAAERLAADDWDRINQANWLHESLLAGTAPVLGPVDPLPDAVVVCVGPLRWQEREIGGAPAIVALREVETPEGIVTQGLQVDLDAALSLAGVGLSEARLTPNPTQPKSSARLPLAGVDWFVTVDALAAGLGAEAGRATLRDGFLQAYLLGLGIAVLAGMGAVGLAWKASRIARERSEFAAAVAHELRTPLTSLRLHTHLIGSALADAPEMDRARDSSGRIAAEAERLGRVVSNLLALNLGERGELPVRMEQGDLEEVVRESVTRQEPALELAGASVSLQVEDDLPAVRFDRSCLEHVIANLLDNAEKYTRGCDDRAIEVRLERAEDGTGVVLSVEDGGEGVPRRSRRRIFKPFSRAAGEDAPAGLGLGLAFARNLARAHDGELSCSGSRRGGARFELKLPVALSA
ncbi:MAG: HAMP domain-containing sensor histidine kinase, partial [Acidobacteriota bacterium]